MQRFFVSGGKRKETEVMGFDRKTTDFIDSVCRNVYKVKDYNEFIKRVTDLVDEYGAENSLDEDAMDAIENAILIKLGR